jgi:hypothetical protein
LITVTTWSAKLLTPSTLLALEPVVMSTMYAAVKADWAVGVGFVRVDVAVD